MVKIRNKFGRFIKTERYKAIRYCLKCEKPMMNRSQYHKKYCSKKCYTNAQTTGRNFRYKITKKANYARSSLHSKLKMGIIKKGDQCEFCGTKEKRIEAAHYNYDEPYRVKWLCHSCHIKWDLKYPKNGLIKIRVPHIMGHI